MADSSGSFQLVGIAEAVRILNISDSTVRRLIRAGRLEAQRVERSQGHVWLVNVPSPGHQSPEQPSRQIGAADGQPSAPPALASWMASVLEPIMAALSLSRQQLVTQAETIGQLRAELAAARAPQQPQAGPGTTPTAEPTTESPEGSRRSWWRWW